MFLSILCLAASFLLEDLPGERRASIAFRVYFLLLAIIMVINTMSDPLPLLLHILLSVFFGIIFSALVLGLKWRAHSKIPDNIVYCMSGLCVIACIAFQEFIVFVVLISNVIFKSLAAYVVWYREPVRNKADNGIIILLVIYIVMCVITILDFSGHYSMISFIPMHLIGPAFIAGFAIFLIGSYMIDFRLELERQANSDPMTGLYNRRAFQEHADRSILLSKRYNTPLTIALCDLDKFKNVNDAYGHNVGDDVILAFAEILKSSIRDSDIVARYGGEEFIILFPNTDEKTAIEVLERIREQTEKTEIQLDTSSLNFTASFGLTCISSDTQLCDAVKNADQALYKAKTDGRNRVCVFGVT